MVQYLQGAEPADLPLLPAGQQLSVDITRNTPAVVNETGTAPVEPELPGETRRFTDRITVKKT